MEKGGQGEERRGREEREGDEQDPLMLSHGSASEMTFNDFQGCVANAEKHHQQIIRHLRLRCL